MMRLRPMKECSFKLLTLLALISLSGCALSNSGPSYNAILDSSDSERLKGIQVVSVNDKVVTKLTEYNQTSSFAELFPSNRSNNYLIGPGDIVEVNIWEAPPAMLFGSRNSTSVGATSTNAVTLPTQMVAADGTITIPFVGRVALQGKTIEQVEAVIVKELRGKANQPSVLLRVTENNTSSVTVVGEVTTNTKMGLTPRGERLLDAIAAGGGVTKEVDRTAVQVSRSDVTGMMPLGSVIRDPEQNILLAPGDVVTALYQPRTFSVLGQTGKNEEIPFEAQGISLAQAIARSGGVRENTAEASAVFVFRFEDAQTFNSFSTEKVPATTGLVPAVYNVDFKDPASFLVTQKFPVKNKDVIYVATSDARQTEKFLRLLLMITSPAATGVTLAN